MRTSQAIVFNMAREIYGDVVNNPRYQAFRFLEEAMELAQVQGLTADDMKRVVDYVTARPTGNSFDEIGDVELTLKIFATAIGLDTSETFIKCVERFGQMDVEKARLKDQRKIKAGLI